MSIAICPPVAAAADALDRQVAVTMQPHAGYFSEHCLELRQDQPLDYRFVSPFALDFNLHHHPEAGGTVYAARREGEREMSGSITAASAGEYCFMWKNPADRERPFQVDLHYQLPR